MSLDQSEHGEPGPLQRLLRRLIVVHPEEVRVVLWCWLYIFSVLSSYYIMRPIRDQMGIAGGVNNLQWLFTGTLIGMLVLNLPFAWLVTKLPRSRFIPITYHFFALNILLFAVALLVADQEQAVWVGRIFFIWASIYNLFVVSVFWQLNVDLFSPEQGKRLFGFIAAGATVGAIVGSASYSGAGALCIANLSADRRGDPARNRCVQRRSARAIVAEAAPAADRRARTVAIRAADRGRYVGRHYQRGTLALPAGGQYLYVAVRDHLDLPLFPAGLNRQPLLLRIGEHKPRSLPSVDLAVNVLTLVVQLLFTGRIILGLGVGLALAVLPAITIIGFGALAFAPTLFAIALFQVIRRAGDYAIARPTREVLFTVVPREDRYKTKGFIDTFIYRLGDQVGAWSVALLRELGAGIAVGVAILIAGLWLLDAIWLGRREEVLEATRPAREAADG